MTLPSSGALSLADIQGEFGGANPIGLNEYYAGGGLVPAGTTGTNGAVPSSGAISIYNFYGTSNILPLRWGDTGSTYHAPIVVYGGTYGTEQASITATTGGAFNFFVPTDAGGDGFYTTFVGGGPTSGYRVRIYNSTGSGIVFYDVNGNPIYTGNWSSYFYITSDIPFYINTNYSGTIEFSNASNSQVMSLDFSGYINYYA
jgi:hypothetical protein